MSKIIEAIVNLIATIIISATYLIMMGLEITLRIIFYSFIILLVAKCAGF